MLCWDGPGHGKQHGAHSHTIDNATVGSCSCEAAVTGSGWRVCERRGGGHYEKDGRKQQERGCLSGALVERCHSEGHGTKRCWSKIDEEDGGGEGK